MTRFQDYREAFDALPVPATLIDAQGIIVDVNRAFFEYTRARGREVNKAERVGYHVAEFVTLAAKRERFRQFIDGLLRDGEDRDLLESSYHKDGRPRHTRIQARCLQRDGRVAGAVLLHEDVTRRILDEERTALSQELRDEVWNMRSADDVERILVAVRDGLRKFGLPFDDCGVNVVDPDEGSVRFHSMTAEGEWKQAHSEAGVAVVLDIWRRGEIAHRRDLSLADEYGEAQGVRTIFGRPVRTVVDVPFSRGTLAINSIEADAFTENDLEILSDMARVLSEGFERVADLEALRRSEERYRATVNQIADAVFLVDLQDLEILESNPAAEGMLGYLPGGLTGRNLTDIVAHDRDSIEANARVTLELGEHFIGGRQYRRLDGTLVDVEVRISRITYGGREVGCAVARDVTERRRAEGRHAALQRLREEVWRMQTGHEVGKLHGLAQQAMRDMGVDFEHFGINLVNPDERTPVRAFTDIRRSGRSLQASREVQLKSVVGWWREGRPVLRPDLEADDAYGERAVIQEGFGQPIRSVLDVPFSHGTVAVNSLLPHAFDEQDVACVQQLAEALSEGFRRTDDLRLLAQQREYLEVTLRSIGDGVIATDAEGRVQLVNEAAEQITGWSQAEATGRPLGEVFVILDESTRQPRDNPVNSVAREGQGFSLASGTILVARDGSESLLAESAAPIRDEEGRIVGVVLVFQDVTAQRQSERERERAARLESLGVLAGGIAHDFNNILTGITGNLSLARLEARTDPERLGPLLDSAEAAAQRAARLTAQLLTFARGGVPARRSVGIAEVVREAADFALRGSNVRSQYRFDEHLWPVHADPNQLSQVVQNLVINADQAMPEGGLLSIEASNVEHSQGTDPGVESLGRSVRLRIRDEGPGIDETIRERIFEPYFTTKETGSGLGLATVYAIIDQHEGHIEVESSPDHGTTFTITLPAAATAPIDETDSDGPLPAGQGSRVLVMDDEPAVLALLAKALAKLGYDAQLTESGQDAVQACHLALEEHRPFAAVILDLTVPGGMGGVQALAALRELAPELQAVVSSGYSRDPILANHRRHGFQGMLPKPYSIGDLAKVLAEVIPA